MVCGGSWAYAGRDLGGVGGFSLRCVLEYVLSLRAVGGSVLFRRSG